MKGKSNTSDEHSDVAGDVGRENPARECDGGGGCHREWRFAAKHARRNIKEYNYQWRFKRLEEGSSLVTTPMAFRAAGQ